MPEIDVKRTYATFDAYLHKRVYSPKSGNIKNFKTVSKRITAKLIAEGEFEKRMEEFRKKGET